MKNLKLFQRFLTHHSLIALYLLLINLPVLAQEGWEWQNPLPQGNAINDLCIIDENTTYAVGNNGTFMKTTDGGQHWEIQYNCGGCEYNFMKVQFSNKDVGWIVPETYLASKYILKTTDAGKTWKQQDFMHSDNNFINNIFFLNTNIGWAGGSFSIWQLRPWDGIYKTTDGGDRWTKQNLPLPTGNGEINDIFFLNESIGWAVGNSTGDYNIFKTTDGGNTWNHQDYPLREQTSLTDVHFINEQIGWVLSGSKWRYDHKYILLNTTNGGKDWAEISRSTEIYVNDMYFTNADTGWMAGNKHFSQSTLLQTKDGGRTWVDSKGPMIDNVNLNALAFDEHGTAWAAGEGGCIIKSTDQGETWKEGTSAQFREYLSSVFFINNQIGWASCGSYVAKTTNGGKTWNTHNYSIDASISDVFFIDEKTGWAVGSGREYILRTRDGGATWIPCTDLPYISYIEGLNSVFFIDAQTGWAVGSSEWEGPGLIMKTTDGGENWQETQWGQNARFNSVFFTDADHGWVVGEVETTSPDPMKMYCGVVLKTTDGGVHWTSQSFDSDKDRTFNSVFFIDRNTGWAVGDMSYIDSVRKPAIIIKTTDGGVIWHEQNSDISGSLESVFFVNHDLGWACGRYDESGYLLSTTDGGLHWEHGNRFGAFSKLYFPDAYHGWAVGNGGKILKWTSPSIPNTPPHFESSATATAKEDSAFSYTARASDQDADPIAFSFQQYPEWLSPRDSTITGTPREGAKDTSFVVIASDGELADTLMVGVDVLPVNDPPAITSPSRLAATEDVLFTYTVTATDPENAPLAFLFTHYPSWLTPNGATLSGTPREGAKDTSFVVIASDVELADTLMVTVNVLPVNDPPVITSAGTVAATEHQPFRYTARAADPEKDNIAFIFSKYPAWLTARDSLISGIPGEGARDTTFTVIASDGSLRDTLVVVLSVRFVNDPPVITSAGTVAATEHQPFHYIARASDPERDDIIFLFDKCPVWLAARDSLISGIPGEGALDTTFTVIASDGSLRDTLAVILSVRSVNNPPIITSPVFGRATEKNPFEYEATASDPEGDSLTFSFSTHPDWLVPEARRICGIPPEGAKDTGFTVIASDSELEDTLRVRIEVIPVNDPPRLISPDSVSAYEDTPFRYIARASDPEESPLNFSFIRYPHWLIPKDSIIAGMALEGMQDTSFVVIASDGELGDTLNVRISVKPVNDPPEIINIAGFSFFTADAVTFALDSCVVDPDDAAQSLHWDVTALDTNLFINLRNRTVRFSALHQWHGTTEVKFKVVDPEGGADSLSVEAEVRLPSAVEQGLQIIPESYCLAHNYPNPFNPQTTILFGLPKTSEVSIRIFNINGQLVEELLHDRINAGYHELMWNAADCPTGLYFIVLQTSVSVYIKKCILMK